MALLRHNRAKPMLLYEVSWAAVDLLCCDVDKHLNDYSSGIVRQRLRFNSCVLVVFMIQFIQV